MPDARPAESLRTSSAVEQTMSGSSVPVHSDRLPQVAPGPNLMVPRPRFGPTTRRSLVPSPRFGQGGGAFEATFVTRMAAATCLHDTDLSLPARSSTSDNMDT
jgi:hypothetical protein